MTPAEEAAILDIPRDEAERRFDREARRHLGMTGEEFAALVDRGGPLPDHPAVGFLLLHLGVGPLAD